jgi:hypothetical protein
MIGTHAASTFLLVQVKLALNASTGLNPAIAMLQAGWQRPARSSQTSFIEFSIEAGVLLWGMAGVEPTPSVIPLGFRLSQRR